MEGFQRREGERERKTGNDGGEARWRNGKRGENRDKERERRRRTDGGHSNSHMRDGEPFFR